MCPEMPCSSSHPTHCSHPSRCRGDFVAQVPYFPPLQAPLDFTPERCMALLRAAVGPRAVDDLELLTIRPWTMSAMVADQFRKGPVFLAGQTGLLYTPSIRCPFVWHIPFSPGLCLGRGCRASLPSCWGLWDEHWGAGRPQSLLEAGGSAAGAGRRGAAGQLPAGEAPRGHAEHRPQRRQLEGGAEVSPETGPFPYVPTYLAAAAGCCSSRVPEALGLDPRAANLLTSALSSPLAAPLGPAAKALAEGALSLGLMAGGPRGPLRSVFRRFVPAAVSDPPVASPAPLSTYRQAVARGRAGPHLPIGTEPASAVPQGGPRLPLPSRKPAQGGGGGGTKHGRVLEGSMAGKKGVESRAGTSSSGRCKLFR